MRVSTYSHGDSRQSETHARGDCPVGTAIGLPQMAGRRIPRLKVPVGQALGLLARAACPETVLDRKISCVRNPTVERLFSVCLDRTSRGFPARHTELPHLPAKNGHHS